MKRLTVFLAIICLFSCTKEKIVESVSGTWTIVETNSDATGIIQVQSYAPSSEFTVEFGANGQLNLSGANPGQAMSPLWGYNRYEVLPGNIIRFFKSTGSEEIKAINCS
jgi:hypothetical protein